ncbi:formate/nitrite transporter family protein [Thalassococcus sp. CAU 1522]|uniref:Formate/nitrite transporter family protein n=1 Tax=Thalassococcus arenae TaxID=2851652 RepID=A0ABS6N2Z6_9RHOB|nr:formate/nitrite transporter family protein [Thalassococcus arenae]MBV2358383.1 formate/nitrite transporter family protein [Thalassococcus arenae]
MGQKTSSELVENDQHDETVSDATPMATKLVFEVIRRNGEEELARPIASLWWSGIAAGLLIAFSVWGEALLRAKLPDTDWRYIIENIGYSLGFVLVILGRMQLFTENTITTVVPVVLKPTGASFGRLVRLWTIVLAANVVGAFVIATFMAYAPVLESDVRAAMQTLSEHATGMGAAEGFYRGIPAGVLIAALVWMLPSTQSSQLLLIVLFTWLIALGDFTHIVAGSVEMAFLMVQGQLGLHPALTGFFLPVLAGNIVGGTVVFTLLTWAQIKPEIEENAAEPARTA